jgi:hypothetical protein
MLLNLGTWTSKICKIDYDMDDYILLADGASFFLLSDLTGKLMRAS